MIIAIDGPSASGKSTTAKGVSNKLGFNHIDTGSMYRAVTFGLIHENIMLDNRNSIISYLRNLDLKFDSNGYVILNGKNVSNAIRTVEISSKVSKISAIPEIRSKMVDFQRNIAGKSDCVLEGRDIGTVVFPNADYKFYMIADINIRAQRRLIELKQIDESTTIEEIISSIKIRDELDSKRSHSPLKKATDAIEIDTSLLSISQQIEKIVKIVKQNKKET
tara:strand:+ start:518 stop:1177 length:660 start_codon:yes stop_codon:yes gene_type:complete